MIYIDTPAINGGETCAHIFVGLILRITNIFKVKSGSAECFLRALQDLVVYTETLLNSLLMMPLFIAIGKSPSMSKIPG